MIGQFIPYLFEAIGKKIPPQVTLAKELGGLLKVSPGSVYKKMRQESPLSLEEALLLLRHFDVSADRFLFGERSMALGYSGAAGAVRSPLDFMVGLQGQLQALAALPNPRVWYATYELPVFYYMLFPDLIAFKLYVWGRVNWQAPAAVGAAFEPRRFAEHYPAVEALRKALLALYAAMPSREFWPAHALENTLGQIRLCAHAQLLEPRMANELCGQLMALIEEIGVFAAQEKKLPAGEPGGQFELYLNQMIYTNNTILVKSDAGNHVFSTFDNPNYLHSTDPVLVQAIEAWMERIRQNSSKISMEGEIQRNYMLNKMRQRVQELLNELK